MQPRQPGYDVSMPSPSWPHWMKWTTYKCRAWNFPTSLPTLYQFCYSWLSCSQILPSSFGSRPRLPVSSQVPWLWRPFSGKPLQPGWTTCPSGILSPSLTRETSLHASPQSWWAHTPHTNLSSTSGRRDQKQGDVFIRSKNVRRNDSCHLAKLTLFKAKWLAQGHTVNSNATWHWLPGWVFLLYFT